MNESNANDAPNKDLLIELGCEELPPRTLSGLAAALFEGLSARLSDAGLDFDTAASRMYYTPRRLAVLMRSVACRQPDRVLERKGPALAAAFDADGRPTKAALGFARSVGKTVDALERTGNDQGEWLFCRVQQPGAALEDLLFPMLEKALAALPVTRPMRWASHDFSFVRPVHWLVAMHGSEVIGGAMFGHEAGNTTLGHRVHSSGPVTIESADRYESVLESAYVIADAGRRRRLIERQVTDLADAAGNKAVMDDGLLDEVSNLVEWPVALACEFDPGFLDVPPEALIASMQDHQKFFPVTTTEGALTATFVAVANLESRDANAVRKGFERVIRPRLADARFFWDEDRKATVEAWLKQLGDLLFQEKLGSVGDKSKRIATISKKIAADCGIDPVAAERASRLCKCDLVSQMVNEFPELQGTMGRYYAAHWGEDDRVADAIGEHYRPAFSGDRLPRGAIGQIVSLADRADTLTGIFAAGQRPTGNKDPFALRRAALGLVRILLHGEVVIDLDRLLAIAALALQDRIEVPPKVLADLRQFILERLKNHLCDALGYATGLVNAVLDAPLTTLPDFMARLDALRAFMRLEVAAQLVAVNKRISNILRKSDYSVGQEISEDRLVIEEERCLFEDVNSITSRLDELHQAGDYPSSLNLLAGLSDSIDAFFEHVMVMDEDPVLRNNRLCLLQRLKQLFDRVANLAIIN